MTSQEYSAEIASALSLAVGGSHASIKTVMSWTGANERTVKNWFSGKYGPSGPHLVAIAAHCDEVMATFLVLAKRRDMMMAMKLAGLEKVIEALLAELRSEV